MLSGVSVDYYTRLERGHLSGVSDSVLEALAAALQLDDAEREYLLALARVDTPTAHRTETADQQVRDSVHSVLEAMTACPAYVRNHRREILAANHLARALFSEVYRTPRRPVSLCRFIFLEPRAREFFVEWDTIAQQVAAALRTEVANHPDDPELTRLVEDLRSDSREFHDLWAEHRVRRHAAGLKRFHHPVVGELELSFNAMVLAADSGLTLLAYSAAPGSQSEQRLQALADWQPDQEAVDASVG